MLEIQNVELILFDAYGTLFEFESDQFRGAIAQILDDQKKTVEKKVIEQKKKNKILIKKVLIEY